ncbi:MAG: LytR C-terminal domain-containing protein, partial [Nitrospinota bacterium]
ALALSEKALALKPNTPEYVDTRTVILGKEAARQAKKGPPPVAAKRTDDSKKSKKESLKTAKAEGPPKPAAGPATVVVNDLPPPPELAPPAPRPAEKAKTDGRSPPGSAGAWPPPANPPSDLPPAPPVLVGPSAPKDGRAAADGENPDGEKPRRSRLVVMSPSTREAALKTPRAAQRALRLVKRDGRVSGDGSLRIRIKVLDGTGDISNARRVKRLLESNGFDVKRTGLTDKGTWRRTVLFYKPGFGPQAVRVAKVLPGKPKTRPLTWKSAFDIILVVGRDASGP